jgi:DNA-binding GntR family transcriptional regulator
MKIEIFYGENAITDATNLAHFGQLIVNFIANIATRPLCLLCDHEFTERTAPPLTFVLVTHDEHRQHCAALCARCSDAAGALMPRVVAAAKRGFKRP